MAWYKVERESTDQEMAGGSVQRSFIEALGRDVRKNLESGTMARYGAKVYKAGTTAHWIMLVPPAVALATMAALEEFHGVRLNEEHPSLDGFKVIEL